MTTPTRWRIVPAEPTDDMLTHPALDDQISDNHGDRDVRETAQLHWEAMLAAAPAPGEDVIAAAFRAGRRARIASCSNAIADDDYEMTEGEWIFMRAVLAALTGDDVATS